MCPSTSQRKSLDDIGQNPIITRPIKVGLKLPKVKSSEIEIAPGEGILVIP